MTYNLRARSSIQRPCDLDDLSGWFRSEIQGIHPDAVRTILELACTELDQLVRWPKAALLLWEGCNRVPPPGKRQRYHQYPEILKQQAASQKLALDTRPNGPAIAAFLLAGGERPQRLGSFNAWSIHHLYSGKFPYVGREGTTHSAKEGVHFTQAAGLVAAHPVADALCDESPAFTWLLRAHAFQRFGYDPDGVFSTSTDEYGFAAGSTTAVVCTA
jgi:hypothetical protein